MFQDIFAELFLSIETVLERAPPQQSVSERSRLKQFLPHNPCVSPYSSDWYGTGTKRRMVVGVNSSLHSSPDCESIFKFLHTKSEEWA